MPNIILYSFYFIFIISQYGITINQTSPQTAFPDPVAQTHNPDP